MTIRNMLKNTALCAIAAAAIASTAKAQQSYMMTCRGGGSMWVGIGQYGMAATAEDVIAITYVRAAQGAEAHPPAAGECAWIDRGIHADEPNVIQLQETGGFSSSMSCNAQGCDITTQSAAAEYLIKAVRNAETFQVHVYNDRNGRMVVTRVGP